MTTLSIVSDGYLSPNSVLSIFSSGYLSFSAPPVAGGGSSSPPLSPFGGWGQKEDKLAFIKVIDELDIPIIANFLIQYVYKNYFMDKLTE